MNLTDMLHPLRRVIAAAVVVVLAATSVLFGSTASATTESAKPVVTQKTKEWRTAPPAADSVNWAAKDPTASLRKTKEW